jgi:3-oxoadipate enol-lactonase
LLNSTKLYDLILKKLQGNYTTDKGMTNIVVSHHQLKISGCQIHYWLAGPTDRPLVVFTHGVTMDHRMFAAQVKAVSPHYRVLTWDVRGHGLSQPLGETFSIALVVEDLLALLNRLQQDRAILVGHSMGGYVSQELLFRHPARVQALVTIGSTCLTLNQPGLIALGMRLSPLWFRFYPYRLFRWQAARGITVTPEGRAYVDEVLARLSPEQFVRRWTAVVNCIHPEPGYRITQPVLITHGANDPIGFGLMRQQGQAWAARDPHSRYVVIPAAGHNAHQENPKFFNKVLLEFLESVQNVPYRPSCP